MKLELRECPHPLLSWGNSCIHSSWRFVMNYLYPNTLPSISVLFMKLTFSILVRHIPWYILVSCRIWQFWLETKVFVVVAFLLKCCSILWSRIGYTCLIWSDLCMFLNRNKKFSIRLSVMRIHNEQKVNNHIDNTEFVGNIAITPNSKCLKCFNCNHWKKQGFINILIAILWYWNNVWII
jgi:hypothetical protein